MQPNTHVTAQFLASSLPFQKIKNIISILDKTSVMYEYDITEVITGNENNKNMHVSYM